MPQSDDRFTWKEGDITITPPPKKDEKPSDKDQKKSEKAS